MHVLEDDSVAVTDPVIAQRLLVVHERQTVERDHDLVGRHAALDLAERLEVLQLQLLAHIEDEDTVVAERRHRHLHCSRWPTIWAPLEITTRTRRPSRSFSLSLSFSPSTGKMPGRSLHERSRRVGSGEGGETGWSGRGERGELIRDGSSRCKQLSKNTPTTAKHEARANARRTVTRHGVVDNRTTIVWTCESRVWINTNADRLNFSVQID